MPKHPSKMLEHSRFFWFGFGGFFGGFLFNCFLVCFCFVGVFLVGWVFWVFFLPDA